VGGGDAEVPFYRVGGGAGRPGDEGELAAAVEAAVSGGDRPGRWWGVLGGCSSHLGVEGGIVRQRWWCRPFDPGRKTTGWGGVGRAG
jgi:hypothetical protein